jgi:hypothetical protein
MSRKKSILLIILLAVGIGGWYAYREYTRTNKDLADVKADWQTSSAKLISEYEANDSIANKKFLGKIVEVNGSVNEVIKDDNGYYTVVFGESGTMSSVRCSIDTTHQKDITSLTMGSSATVRGACTGFNKDDMGLGSDVILNRCVIIPSKK